MADNFSATGRTERIKPYLPAAFLLAVIVLVSLIRLRLLQVPLERDEGEFAYIGQLILRGIPPYTMAYSLKLPGIFFAYASILQIFGQSMEAIRIGLLIVNVITILLLFLLAKNLRDEYAGIAAGASYAILSLSPSVLGMFSHATHFVMLFIVGGLLIIQKIVKSDRPPVFFLVCGLCFGIGFTMKQHAVFFLVFPVAYLFIAGRMDKRHWKTAFLRSFCYLLGVAIPILAICFHLCISGAWGKFRFWTFDYAREYVSEIPLGIGMEFFVSHSLDVVKPSLFLWLLAGFGLVSLFLRKQLLQDRVFILLLLVLSVFAISPGFYFRKHYYILLLPAISLVIGMAIQYLKMRLDSYKPRAISRYMPLLILFCAIIYSLYHDRNIFFFETPENISRNIYGNNPFRESLPVAKYIENNTASNDRILVLGSEPQIYFYSKRYSATGHIYMYGLMEHQKYARSMQQEMIREILSAKPKFIVVVTAWWSWLFRPDSDMTLVDWANRYVKENYVLVGIADTIGSHDTVFLWEKDAERYVPRSDSIIYVFRRRAT